MADNRLQLGITITADGKAAEAALGRVRSSLQQTKQAAKETSDAWAKLSAAGSANLASITAAQNLTKGMSAAGAAARAAAEESERMRRGIGLLSSELDNGTTSLAGYAKGLAGVYIAYQTIQQAAQAMKAAVDAAAQMDRLKTAMVSASGSAALASTNLAFIEKTAQSLGINLMAAEEGFISLTAAARGTALQGQATQDIFSAVARASAALGKSAEDTQGILNALGQMISKGTVQMEELRGQLGDRLPGAFQVAARAMGMTTSELDKLISQGRLTATEFLPKFAKALDETYSGARFDRINNNIERVDAAWTRFKANIVDTDSISKAIGHLASLLDGLNTLVSKSKAYGEAFNVIPSKSAVDLALAGGKTGLQPISTEAVGGGFKAIEKGAYDAMLSVTKLSEAQKQVAALVIETAKANKVDPAWALAIAQQESGFNQLAKSAAGAQGVMQLMPGTAKQLGVNIADVNDNIKGGVLYLKQQQEQFKSLKLASAAYNAGPGNVTKYGGVPPFQETQNYVKSVAALYQQWQQVLGTQGTVFADAKEQAGELKNAFEQLKTHQDGLVSAAENYAKVQTEKIKTSLAALEAERKATQDVATAQLASAQTYDDKQRLLAAAAQQQDQFNQRAATLAQQELSAQQSVIEARKKALETELANADKYNLTIIEQAKLKQELAAADADLAVLAQQRTQAEIAAGQQANEAAQQSLALKQKEQDAIGGVIAEYERQVEILNRLTQAQQAGASAEQLGFLSQYYGQSGQLPEVVSAEQLQRMQQYQLSTLAVKDAIGEMTKATLDQGKAEQAVREEQLRQNAFWDQLIGRLQDYARTWEEITGNQHDAFAEISVSMGMMLKNIEQVGQSYQDMQDKFASANGGENSGILSIASGIAEAEAALNGMARTLLAVRNQYEIGTQGYKDMTAAAERMMEVQRALSMIEAVLGVIHQATSGDVYTAIPRMIGVAAMMASLGYQTGLGGSGAANADYRAQPGQNGTVFGDATAQSESISKSLEIIRDNTSNDLNYSARMLQALENIETALAGATNAIIRGVSPMAIQGLGHQYDARKFLDPAGINNIDPLAGAISKFVFSVDKQITDFGIQVLPHTIKKMFQNGFQAATYTDVTTTSKVFGVTMSKSTQSYFQALDAEVNKQFTGVITNIAKATKEAGAALGISGDYMTKALNKFVIDIGRVSLANLKGDELQKKLEEMFSTMSDNIARAVVPGLGKFRQVGEGYFETMIRVAEGTQRATGELAQLGLQAVNYREIVNKQGDVAAEIARQTILAQGQLVAGTKDYVNGLTGSSEDIIAAYRKLVQAQNLLAAGFNMNDLDRTLINAAGGLDAFVSAMQSFNDAYLSQADNIAGQLAGLSAQFAQLGQSLPDSKDAFLALMQSIDTSTEAGKELFGGLLQLADAFAKVNDQIDQINQKYAAKLDPMAAIRKTIKDVTDDFAALIAKANSDLREKLIKSGDPKLQGLIGDQAIAAKSASGASDELAAAQKRMGQVWEEIAQINAKGAKITKAERERLSQLTAESIYLDRQIPILESRNAAAQAVLKAAGEIIDEYIKSVADQNRADVLKNAATIMTETLADIMQGLAQTIQEAQQRLDNVLSFQRNLATQIAQLQGSQAIADLANARYGQANNAVNDYIGAIGSGARERDTETELKLLGDLQTAVMDRYNAEMTLINEAIQEQTNALNEALQVEIDAINAAAQAQVDAVNTALDAQIKAIQDASDAQIKAQQKADQEAIKAIQKQNDAAVKAAQKANDAVIKAQQKVYDAQIKALQKQQEAEVKALQQQQEAAIKIWADQLDAANTLRDAIKGIQEYAKSLLLGPQSTLSPEARLAEAQRQYQELAAKARGGDADALSKLSGSTDAYLEAAKSYYGSGTQYQSIFDGVKTAMEGLGAMSAPDPDSIQSHIDALREAQEAQLDALRESQADAVDALREQQGEQLDALREKLNDQIDLMREQQAEALDVIREAQADNIDALREAAQDQIEAARKAAQDQIDAINKAAQDQIKEAQTRTAQAIADLSDPNKNAAMKALKEDTLKKLQEISDLSEKTRAKAEQDLKDAQDKAARQAQEAIQIARDQLKSLDANLDFSAAQITALNNLMTGLNIGYQVPIPQKPVTSLAGGGGLEGVAAYANGGTPPIGVPVWVGERGRELVEFDRPAQVVSNDRIQGAVNGGNAQVVQAIAELRQEIAALRAEARASVSVQSSAFPQVIDKLAALDDKAHALWRDQKVANSSPGRRVTA